MESATKNRIRLWLRGERAFGLAHVPLTNVPLTGRALSENPNKPTPSVAAGPRQAVASAPPSPSLSSRRVDDEQSDRRQASNAPPAALFAGVGVPNEMA